MLPCLAGMAKRRAGCPARSPAPTGETAFLFPGARHNAAMSILFLIIIGAAAGFLATRILDIRASVPATIAVGVLGALIGGLVLRFLLMLTGMAFGFVGALLGALLILWIWQNWFR